MPTTFSIRNSAKPETKTTKIAPCRPRASFALTARYRATTASPTQIDHVFPGSDTSFKFAIVTRTYDGVSQNAVSP